MPAWQIQASFERDVIESVPQALAAEWCASEQVTLAHSQSVPPGILQISLEKDCLPGAAPGGRVGQLAAPQRVAKSC
jgi:hypothetical protein